jgi:two-component system, OmpR family, response regulator CpxR
MTKILMIDDDVEFVQMMREYLEPEGFTVASAHSYDSGLKAAREHAVALIVLDVMLPGGSGFDLLRTLRKESKIPVVLLTGRGEAVDRIVGLEIGADDYLPKPADPRELAARIRAVLRRTEREPSADENDDWIRVGEISLSPRRREILCRKEVVDATSFEFNVLEYLMKNVGKIIPREELAEAALGRKLGMLDRSIDVHLSRLRKKLSACGASEHIKSIRGSGYIFAGIRSDGEHH